MLIYDCALGAQTERKLLRKIHSIMLENYERKTFSLTFPECFDNMQNNELEVITSKRIQSVKIFYRHNEVTHSIALIFVNEKFQSEDFKKGVKAFELLSVEFCFEEAYIYSFLSKSQIIEKLDLLQCLVECFEEEKQGKASN